MEIIVYMLDGCMLFSMARIYALQSLYETNWLCVPASNTCIVYILYMCVMLRNVKVNVKMNNSKMKTIFKK